MFIDEHFVRCTRPLDPRKKSQSSESIHETCPKCVKNDYLKKVYESQIGLVFKFKYASNTKAAAHLVSDTRENSVNSTSKLIVIANSGYKFLHNIWGDDCAKLIPILKRIIDYSSMPHNNVDTTLNSKTYYMNQIFDHYLDKSIYYRYNDSYLKELGLQPIINLAETDEKTYMNNVLKSVRLSNPKLS